MFNFISSKITQIAIFIALLLSIYYLNTRLEDVKTQRDNALNDLELTIQEYTKNIQLQEKIVKAETTSKVNKQAVIKKQTKLKEQITKRGEINNEAINDDFINFSF